jgi:hypothetical protein
MGEVLSLEYLKQCTRKCPNCSFATSKIDGCNKMTCSRCGSYFCWGCGIQIQGYSHFSESGQCGDIIAAELRDTLKEETEEEVKKNLFEKYKDQIEFFDFVVCPSCNKAVDHDKGSKLNLKTCESCKSNFCNNCNKVLDPDEEEAKKHYEISDCYFKNIN